MDDISKTTNTKDREKLLVNSDIFKFLIKLLADKIRNQKQFFRNLYGVPRGGSVVAVYLSHELNIPIGRKDQIHNDTLIVDDIVDSGLTLQYWKKVYGNQFASLFIRDAKTKPDFYVNNAEKFWVVFPYENG